MAFVRCAALTAAMLAAAAPGPTQVSSPALRLHAAIVPSGLLIENTTAQPMLIERDIGVDKLIGATWTRLGTELRAINSCTASGATGPVRLPPHASLAIVPWRGGSCSGQCNHICRANIDYPPGRFRFVVTALPQKTAVIGPAFQLSRSVP